MIRPDQWRGRRLAVATRHGKARALRIPLRRVLGARVFTPRDLDTDALGTFSGEIARTAPPLATAAQKARLALQAAPAAFAALASEASFGPDPVLGFVPLHHEWLVCVPAAAPAVVIAVGLATHATQFARHDLSADGVADADWLARTRFPEHALILRAQSEPARLWRALRSHTALDAALQAARDTGAALQLETDMRAHLNPLRMQHLRRLGMHLALRLATACPDCGAAGFGLQAFNAGLPCRICGSPTEQIGSERHGCAWCGHQRVQPRAGCADPSCCPQCNP